MAANLLPRYDDAWYRVVVPRDKEFDGIFFVAVRSAGIFCRPTCPAPVPRRENCVFFETAAKALQAGFRACLRCKPTQAPGAGSDVVRRLIAAVARESERRWCDKNIKAFGMHASTARRQFRKRFVIARTPTPGNTQRRHQRQNPLCERHRSGRTALAGHGQCVREVAEGDLSGVPA